MTSTETNASDARTTAAPIQDERLIEQHDLRSVLRGFIDRLRGGDLGTLPVVVGLIAICLAFYLIQPRFLSSYNLSSMTLFAAPVGIISLGIVLVLLLGEIDLSVGSASGFTSAVMAVLAVKHGFNPILAILIGIAVGVAIGLVYAFLYTKLGVPSFVFSMAGLLAFTGALLVVLGTDGTVTLGDNSWLVQFAKFGYLPAWLAYALSAVATIGYFLAQLVTRVGRQRAGLSTSWFPLVIVKALALGAVLVGLTYYLGLGLGRGWPNVWLVFVVLVVLVDLALRKTRWGRHVYAVGGNEEAARRAGIKVDRTYISVFVLCSALAALGGILNAGVLGSVSQTSGTTDTNLTAIAAAVIGGASLFGGRGSAFAAMLGILVLQAITSGLNQLSVGSAVRYIVTGAVLLLAVAIDSVSRRARASSGRG